MQQNKSPKFEYLVSPFHAKNPNGRPCNEQSTQFVSLHLNSNVPLFYEKPAPRHKLGAVKKETKAQVLKVPVPRMAVRSLQ